jgi:cellulose biosynthesis protein BcsQ
MENLVIAIIGDKGGIGKTLIGYNLIYRLIQDEPSAQLIDCDTDQYSSAEFAEDRRLAGIKPELPVINISPKNLETYLLTSSKKIKVHIIEFGKSFGEDDKDRQKALELAVKLGDIILCPMQPTRTDAKAFGKFELKLPPLISKKPAILIPNRVKSAARLQSVIDLAPQLRYFKVAESYISDLTCYQDCFDESGLTVFEIKAKSNQEYKAQREFEQLYQEIINISAEFYG